MTNSGVLICAVDIGGTKIAVGLVDSSGRILAQASSPTSAERGLEDGLQRIYALTQTCLEAIGAPFSALRGVGIGCTGPVDPVTGVLGPNSFLPSWEGEQLIVQMEQMYQLPIAIENDGDAAALGEYAWGAGRGSSRFIYVTVSTGIGTGVVLDGRLYRGVNGAHPEMGHHVIDASSGPQCFCGARGCWEILAAGPALAAWYNDQRKEAVDPAGNPMDAQAICQRAISGEPLALHAVEREGRYLGIGLANLITLFTPDVIALGGGLMESWPLFEDRVHQVIRQHCGLVPYQLTKILPASLGARTGLSGAARVWFHRYGEQNA